MSLTVNEIKSVDIVATGTVIFDATGNVNVGSSGSLSLESVTAGNEARITAQRQPDGREERFRPRDRRGRQRDPRRGETAASAPPLNPLFVALSAGSLTASASDDIYITETQYDMRIADVYSNADVYLTAARLDPRRLPGQTTQPEWEIGAQSASLQAGGGIGTGTNYIGTLLSGGTITANAAQGIFLHQVSGDMDVSLVDSAQGDVALWADGNLLDASLGVGPVAIGDNITLQADSGGHQRGARRPRGRLRHPGLGEPHLLQLPRTPM